MDMLLDILSWALLAGGSFFIIVGNIGLVRMPDLFTRMHAASLVDTLGAGLFFVLVNFTGLFSASATGE